MAPSRHLTNDDPYPPRKAGTLRLYSMHYCPFALRARLILAKHGVEYELINVALRKQKPQWFLDKYSVGTVPVLETDEGILGGSIVISHHVDEAYSQNGETCFPVDPFEKAKTNMLIEDKFSKAIMAVFGRLYQDDNWEEAFFQHVGELEKVLETKKFFACDNITFADYMIWPWLRLVGPVIDDVLPSGKFKNIERWIWDMNQDNTVRSERCYTKPEVLREYCKGDVTKDYVYDLE